MLSITALGSTSVTVSSSVQYYLKFIGVDCLLNIAYSMSACAVPAKDFTYYTQSYTQY